MRHLAVYMLLVLGGNAAPTKDDVTKALATVGIDADDGRLVQLLEGLKDKNLDELISAGMGKLASFGGGGGKGDQPAGPSDVAASEEKKEEPKEEEEEEIDMGGGMSMFGGDEGGGDY